MPPVRRQGARGPEDVRYRTQRQQVTACDVSVEDRLHDEMADVDEGFGDGDSGSGDVDLAVRASGTVTVIAAGFADPGERQGTPAGRRAVRSAPRTP